MRNTLASCLLIGFLVVAASAQLVPQPPKPGVSSSNQAEIDAVLQRYLSAYQHKNFDELLAVWPDLVKEKKECDRIKHHFEDGTLSDEQMTVTPLEVQPTADGAVVRVDRKEKFVKSETTSSLGAGELLGTVMTPTTTVKKRDIKKDDKVWITMHRANGDWTIVSISDKNPLPAARPVI